MATTTKRLWNAGAVAVLATLAAAVGSQCGGSGEALIGPDAAVESGPVADSEARIDAGPDLSMEADAIGSDTAFGVDVAGTCDTAPGEAGSLSDWPGWRRLVELDPCCRVDVPVDPVTTVPPLEWNACADGTPSCLEMKVASRGTGTKPFVPQAVVTRDLAGAPSMLLVGWAHDTDKFDYESDLYDFKSSAPLAAFRGDVTPTGPICAPVVSAYGRSVTVFARLRWSGDIEIAHGDPASLMMKPVFQRLGGWELLYAQDLATSETTYGFDLAGAAVIRTTLGSGAYVTTSGKTTVKLFMDFVERSDVFAASERGTDGWNQEYVIASDGTPTLFRGKAGRHIDAFRTDGTTMFWVESWGGTAPTDPRTDFEVWTAPYTSDPSVLAGTARLLAPIRGTRFPYYAVAFQGFFAVHTGLDVEIVRLSDGAVREVLATTKMGFASLALVTPTEIWVVTGEPLGAPATAFRRVGVAW